MYSISLLLWLITAISLIWTVISCELLKSPYCVTCIHTCLSARHSIFKRWLKKCSLLNEPASHFRLLTCTFSLLTDPGPALLTNLGPHLVLLSLHSLSFCCTAVFLLKREKPSESLLIHCLYPGLAKMSMQPSQNILWKKPQWMFWPTPNFLSFSSELHSPPPQPGLHVTACILSFACLLQYCLFMEKFLHELSI